MSGSRVFDSGVGTQIEMTSISAIRSQSVVASILPAFTSAASSSEETSPMYDSPLFTRSTFSLLTSKPVARNPVFANSTARGRPT